MIFAHEIRFTTKIKQITVRHMAFKFTNVAAIIMIMYVILPTESVVKCYECCEMLWKLYHIYFRFVHDQSMPDYMIIIYVQGDDDQVLVKQIADKHDIIASNLIVK